MFPDLPIVYSVLPYILREIQDKGFFLRTVINYFDQGGNGRFCFVDKQKGIAVQAVYLTVVDHGISFQSTFLSLHLALYIS